jgi:hemoglobin
MADTKDISTIEDVHLMVNSFYGKVQQDELLGSIFNGVIQSRWPQHLEKMYRFWQTVLLTEHTYFSSPFPPHAKLPIAQQHFDRWLHLWHTTIDEHFSGSKAEEAKWRGDKMAVLFLSKINYYRSGTAIPLV